MRLLLKDIAWSQSFGNPPEGSSGLGIRGGNKFAKNTTTRPLLAELCARFVSQHVKPKVNK